MSKDKTPVTISPYLGSGDVGRRRKAALKEMARKAGHFHNRRPSIGRWLVAVADGIKTKPQPSPLCDEQLRVVENMHPQELDDLEDAIEIVRLRAMVRRLVASGFEFITGDSDGWAWESYVWARDPASPNAVQADLEELRVLLDTVREMRDPAAAFARWLPKVKAVADE